MYLNDLEQGQKINLTARIGSEILEFESTVVDTVASTHSILAETIIKNDRVISFKGKGLLVDLMIYSADNAPKVFKNVSIKLVQLKGIIYYNISSLAEALTLNRRQSFRMYVGEAVVIQCGSNHSTVDGVLKDISNTGFAVTLEEARVEMHEGQVIHTVLNDRIDEIAKNYTFQLYGLIVRKVELENGRVIYGCKLNNPVPGLENYIMIKERIRIRDSKS